MVYCFSRSTTGTLTTTLPSLQPVTYVRLSSEGHRRGEKRNATTLLDPFFKE